MISTSEEIAQVATLISANGDREIGELIAEAMEKVGKRGVISIRELDNPVILIHENKINNVNTIVKVSELAFKRQRSLLIVAENVEGEALKTLIILNNLHASMKVCAIKPPWFGREENGEKVGLHDLAILTGGQVITEGVDIDDVEFDMLGSCKKVTISSYKTIIHDGAGDKKTIEKRCEEIRSKLERIRIQRSTDLYHINHYDKRTWEERHLEERLGNLSGGVAVLEIGGANGSKICEKFERVTNVLDATKAAVEEGILPGGGVALLYASKELDKLQTANLDQKIGVQIIQNALKTPVHTIATNAGVEGAVVVGKLLEQNNPDLGYDAAKGEYVDMVKAGIIDPLKVIRTALMDAASLSSSSITTKAFVFKNPEDEKKTSSNARRHG